MILTRRSFLASSAALLATPSASQAQPFTLRAEQVTAQILPVGDPKTQLLGFNGSTPGPEIRLTQGEMLRTRFENGIDQGSAVHWHGIRIDNTMDGVPGLTQDMVNPGDGFDYSFQVPDAGTYWYHSHNRSWEQVAKGLYGPLIVEELSPPAVDHDITVMIDDWRMDEVGTLIGGFGAMHDFAHGGRLGNFARAIASRDTVRLGDRIRLRLINVATARVFPVDIEGIDGQVVALDGMPLETPQIVEDMVLAPAQRLDIIADVTGSVRFIFPTPNERYELGEIAADGSNPTPITSKISPLPAANTPVFPENPDQSLTLRLQGGAMGGSHGGSDIWSINNVSGMGEAPFARFSLGEAARLTLINETAFPHGIHLHGHHFFEMNPDGTPGPLRDTTLVAARESRDIVCVFDNPGKWLLHCHMLEHQASGMKTWVEVT